MNDDGSLVALAERIIAVLDYGRFSYTYKYATLHAILDLVAESPTPYAEPVVLYMPRLAERVIELYLPQTLPYPGPDDRPTLSQGREGIVAQVARFRAEHGANGFESATTLRRRHGTKFDSLCLEVEATLARYPVQLLQKVGSDTTRFLYDYSWKETISRTEVKRGVYDNRIFLKPGVAPALLRLGGLLRPLIQSQWARMVADMNSLAESKLEQFLFGSERAALTPLMGPLIELQHGRCFYCKETFTRANGRRPEVDHFVPWSRYRDDNLANLVAAHQACNAGKRDHFAATPHLIAWRHRLLAPEDLQAIAHDQAWDCTPQRSDSIARALYLALPESTPLWHGRDHFETLNRPHLPTEWLNVSAQS